MPMPVMYAVLRKKRPRGIVCQTLAKLASVGGRGMMTGGNAKTVPPARSEVASSHRNGNAVTTASARSAAARAADASRQPRPWMVRLAPDGAGAGRLNRRSSVIRESSLSEQPETRHGQSYRHRGQDHPHGGRVPQMQRVERLVEHVVEHRVR